MFTHDQIWAAIDRLADSRGFSASGLARQAGLDPTAFNRSKRISPNGKPRWPSTESLAKILAVTDCTMRDLLSLIEGAAPDAPSIPILAYNDARSGKNTPRAKAEHYTPRFDLDAPDMDMTFALVVEDNRLSPLFRNGSTLILSRHNKAGAQDRILFYHTEMGLCAGIVEQTTKKSLMISMPDANNSGALISEQISEDDLSWAARILWASH